jgi:hypothetical protein
MPGYTDSTSRRSPALSRATIAKIERRGVKALARKNNGRAGLNEIAALAFKTQDARPRGEGSLSENLSRCAVPPRYRLIEWGSR